MFNFSIFGGFFAMASSVDPSTVAVRPAGAFDPSLHDPAAAHHRQFSRALAIDGLPAVVGRVFVNSGALHG